jgi:hypothetical protein
LIRDFFVWIAKELGKGPGEYDPTWSDALASSLNFWGLLEGTHVLTLMLFAGTIFIVDLRLLGLIFKKTPASVISDRVLPLTIFGMVIMVATGTALVFAKPLLYYHNVWFRLKLVFLAIAFINIIVMHYRLQRNMAEWDALPKPPAKIQVSAAVSLACWLLVITFGRFIAYDWYNCGKPLPAWANAIEECKTSETGAVDLKGNAL